MTGLCPAPLPNGMHFPPASLGPTVVRHHSFADHFRRTLASDQFPAAKEEFILKPQYIPVSIYIAIKPGIDQSQDLCGRFNTESAFRLHYDPPSKVRPNLRRLYANLCKISDARSRSIWRLKCPSRRRLDPSIFLLNKNVWPRNQCESKISDSSIGVVPRPWSRSRTGTWSCTCLLRGVYKKKWNATCCFYFLVFIKIYSKLDEGNKLAINCRNLILNLTQRAQFRMGHNCQLICRFASHLDPSYLI